MVTGLRGLRRSAPARCTIDAACFGRYFAGCERGDSHTYGVAWAVVWWALGVFSFSTVGALLLLSTTSQITRNAASMSLLWIGPMVLYLVTFVIAFSGVYPRWSFVLLFVATQAWVPVRRGVRSLVWVEMR